MMMMVIMMMVMMMMMMVTDDLAGRRAVLPCRFRVCCIAPPVTVYNILCKTTFLLAKVPVSSAKKWH